MIARGTESLRGMYATTRICYPVLARFLVIYMRTSKHQVHQCLSFFLMLLVYHLDVGLSRAFFKDFVWHRYGPHYVSVTSVASITCTVKDLSQGDYSVSLRFGSRFIRLFASQVEQYPSLSTLSSPMETTFPLDENTGPPGAGY